MTLSSQLKEDYDFNYLYGTISMQNYSSEKDETESIASSLIYILKDQGNLLDVADSISGDILFVAEAVKEMFGGMDLCSNYAFLDELTICKKAIDSLKLRSFFLNKVINYLKWINIDSFSFLNEAVCKDSSEDVNGKYLNRYLKLGCRPIMHRCDKNHIILNVNMNS
jgi:hypothetical protein